MGSYLRICRRFNRKSHFLKSTALSVVVLSGLVNPLFTSSSRAMGVEEQLAPPAPPSRPAVKKTSDSQDLVEYSASQSLTVDQGLYILASVVPDFPIPMGGRSLEITDWKVLRDCRLVSKGWNESAKYLIINKKLIGLTLSPADYKDERIKEIAHLVTSLVFVYGWQGDNFKNFGAVVNIFPCVQEITYCGQRERNFFYPRCLIGRTEPQSRANLLKEGGVLPGLTESCGTDLSRFFESLSALPKLQSLVLLGNLGNSAAGFKKLSPCKEVTFLALAGNIDRLVMSMLHEKLEEGGFAKLKSLKIFCHNPCKDFYFVKEEFKKIKNAKPEIESDFQAYTEFEDYASIAYTSIWRTTKRTRIESIGLPPTWMIKVTTPPTTAIHSLNIPQKEPRAAYREQEYFPYCSLF